MSAHANPDIVDDNLVFMYDTDDGKSYKGEPTTNVVANPLPTTGWSVSQAQGSALTRTYLTEDGIPFMRFSGVTNGNDYPRITNSVFANSATITGTFSTSLEVKGTAGAVLRLRIYENGSTKITNSITLTSEWTRYTFDNQSTGFNLNQPYFNPATSDAIYDIRNIQVEAKSHSTPFVNGTRSATQGLIDRTGTSTIDISNASFDSNAQITFDGTDDYANVDHQSSYDTNVFTIEAWFKSTADDNTHDSIVTRNGDVYSSTNGWSLGKLRNGLGDTPNALRWIVWGTSAYTDLLGGSATTGNWIHAVGVSDGSTLYLYQNGVLKTSSSKPTGNIYPASYGLKVGANKSSSDVWNGYIDSVKMYNKALTASEVLQNFNATKSRFSL